MCTEGLKCQTLKDVKIVVNNLHQWVVQEVGPCLVMKATMLLAYVSHPILFFLNSERELQYSSSFLLLSIFHTSKF